MSPALYAGNYYSREENLPNSHFLFFFFFNSPCYYFTQKSHVFSFKTTHLATIYHTPCKAYRLTWTLNKNPLFSVTHWWMNGKCPQHFRIRVILFWPLRGHLCFLLLIFLAHLLLTPLPSCCYLSRNAQSDRAMAVLGAKKVRVKWFLALNMLTLSNPRLKNKHQLFSNCCNKCHTRVQIALIKSR